MATQITETQTVNAPTETVREVVSYDPATGEEVGRVPLRSAEEVGAAVARARAAQ
jgi:acyl-CoA reductase-like NAD-dependent aldehyde dehydrogenase